MGTTSLGANEECWTRGREQKLANKPRVFTFNPHVKTLVPGLHSCEDRVAGITSARKAGTFPPRMFFFLMLVSCRTGGLAQQNRRYAPSTESSAQQSAGQVTCDFKMKENKDKANLGGLA